MEEAKDAIKREAEKELDKAAAAPGIPPDLKKPAAEPVPKPVEPPAHPLPPTVPSISAKAGTALPENTKAPNPKKWQGIADGLLKSLHSKEKI